MVTIGDSVNDIFIKPCGDKFCNEQINLNHSKLMIRHGDKILVDEIHDSIGGGATNVAIGLSRLGLRTAIISTTGEDTRGEKIRNRLIEENVSVQMLKSLKEISTSTSVIIVYQKERTVFVYRGNKDFSQVDIPKTIKTKWIYISSVPKEFSYKYSKLISLASEKNVNLAINPGNRQLHAGRSDLLRLLKVVKVIFLNRQEASELVGIPKTSNITKLLDVIKSYGPEIVVITEGKEGAYTTDGEASLGINSYSISEVVDPTGAGDGFSSGFLASYIQEHNLPKALQSGIVNSASVIQQYGANSNLQTAAELKKLLKYAPDIYKL